MASRKPPDAGSARNNLKDKNATTERVQKLADVNAAAVARVLKSWLRGEEPKKDK